MFNISEKVEIKNLKKTGCSAGHIRACIYDENKHEKINYSYFGKRVSKGNILLHTCTGDFILIFDEKDGWARSVEIL